MSTLAKILLVVIALAAVAFGITFLTSRYLASKLDGTDLPPEQPVVTMLQYSSEDGYTFQYPDTYELSSRPGPAADGDVLVLLPKGSMAPVGGEGPPAIAISTFRTIGDTTLEQWVRTDMRSNFQLSPDKKLTRITLGGEPALAYTHSGLYETDAIAVKKDGTIYLFSVGRLTREDRIRRDFGRIFETLRF